MDRIKRNLPFIVRLLISALFLLSAIAKSFPLWSFEKQIVDLGIVDWCLSHYLARAIIAFETAIAIAILQKHFLRSIVVPLTLLLLVAFCIHLGIQMYQNGAMNGNCGCFGQLIPMTPLEAFIKNIITILLLLYVWKKESDLPKGQNRFSILLLIYSISALVMFVFFPFAPCFTEKEEVKKPLPVVLFDSQENDVANIQTADTSIIQNPASISKDTSGTSLIKDSLQKQDQGPAKMVSKFSEFTEFGGRKVNLDEGKKILCMFVPGCDHCRDAAKALVALRKKQKLPPVYIIFMDEELFKLEEFYKETGCNFPHTILSDIPKFFKLLGNNASTPGVFYLWNGNVIKSFEGVGANQFKAEELSKALQKAPK
jgi:hypothetical protein